MRSVAYGAGALRGFGHGPMPDGRAFRSEWVRGPVPGGAAADAVAVVPVRYFASLRPRSVMPDSAFSWPASTPAVKPDLAVASWTAV